MTPERLVENHSSQLRFLPAPHLRAADDSTDPTPRYRRCASVSPSVLITLAYHRFRALRPLLRLLFVPFAAVLALVPALIALSQNHVPSTARALASRSRREDHA